MLIKAILQEWSGQSASAVVAQITSEIFAYTMGGGQGRKETPMVSNLLLAETLEFLVRSWKSAGRGCGIAETLADNSGRQRTLRLTHLTYADNVWLISPSRLQLELAFAECTTAVRSRGLKWKESSLEVISSCGRTASGW